MTENEQQDAIKEFDDLWLVELETADPAAVRGYFHAIVKMGRYVWLYGILGMSARVGSTPNDIMMLLNDRQAVAGIAQRRGISLEGTDQITQEEHDAYEEAYQRVYKDVVVKYVEFQDAQSLASLNNMPLEA